MSRNSGSASTIKIIGKHNFAAGGFINFQVNIDEDVLIHGQSVDSDGSNIVVLSKKIDRQLQINLNVNALLDGISEASWIAADTGGGTIVIDGTTNYSLYIYLINTISSYLEIKFL
ncbi:MAG: hypothetical protein JKY54_17760 [Flavobacteriales bacterium]|nr:hypothetical protein [Flavobacteriales bacterium]